MVDRNVRKQLSQVLRRLITGRMTNDEFDEAYYERFGDSSDRAVAEIGAFGYSLYSSDLLRPYRLKGRHAVDKSTRRIAARCVLFLRTNLGYQWPKVPSSTDPSILYSLAFLGIPVGIALLICSIPLLIGGVRDVGFLWLVALSGLGLLLASVCYRLGRSGFAAEYDSPEWRAWRSSGDFDVWPFFRREDYYEARRTAHLLGPAESASEL